MFRKLSLRALVAAIALVAAPAVLAGAAHADERDRGGRGGNHGNNYNNNHGGNRGGWDNDRGRDHGRGRDYGRGRDWDRGRDYGHYDNRRGDNLSLSFSFGSPHYGYVAPRYYDAPSYRAPVVVYNTYGLRPYDCRDEQRWDYWRGRPAEVVVQLCANAYGDIYVVEGSHRFLRYRY